MAQSSGVHISNSQGVNIHDIAQLDTLLGVHPINEFSIDGTMTANSDTKVPTEKAVVTYAKAAADFISTSGTITFAAGAPWIAAQDIPYRLTRVRCGSFYNVVFQLDGAMFAPANPPGTADSQTQLAADYRPDVLVSQPVTAIVDNECLGTVVMDSTGWFTMYWTPATAAGTALLSLVDFPGPPVGNVGWRSFTMTWTKTV